MALKAVFDFRSLCYAKPPTYKSRGKEDVSLVLITIRNELVNLIVYMLSTSMCVPQGQGHCSLLDPQLLQVSSIQQAISK